VIQTLNDYQDFVSKTHFAAKDLPPLLYPALGLAGETGEVIEHIKKITRDYDNHIPDDIRQKLILELGDVLWYVTRISSVLGTTLREVIEGNVNKLTERRANGKRTG
jgi:NTP pyrophosphatase (non-canonical NTP hydrolase)